MAASPYTRTTYDGNTVNWRTRAMLEQAARYLGYHLTVLQGSYNAGGVGASAGTHDGGGAVDLVPFEWQKKVRVLREVGFAAWHRPTLFISGKKEWDEHIHCIAIGDKQMSLSAAHQVQDYYAGLNGLADHARDDEWQPNPIVKFHYPLAVVALDNVLRNISNGAETSMPGVRAIQRALNIKTGTHLKTDGLYGPSTRDAFRRYERQNGGDGDGYPGALTQKLGLALFRVK